MLKTDIERIVEGGVEMATGLAFILPSLIMMMHTVLIGLFVGGVVLIVVRLAFFWMCPFLVRHAATVAVLVNYIIFFLEIFADAAIAVIDAVIAIVDVLTGHATNNLIEFINPLNNEVSADEIRSELSYLTETCVPYDDAYGIVYKLTLSYTHFGACGIARYLYPVQWVFQLVNPILEMFYTGNARPVDGYETGQGQHNCEDILHSHYDVVTVCCGIGSGYVILELLLPLLLLVLILLSIGKGLLRVFRGVLGATYDTIRLTYKYVVAKIIDYIS